MACFTVSLVVSGPGVKRSFRWLIAWVPRSWEKPTDKVGVCRGSFLWIAPFDRQQSGPCVDHSLAIEPHKSLVEVILAKAACNYGAESTKQWRRQPASISESPTISEHPGGYFGLVRVP